MLARVTTQPACVLSQQLKQARCLSAAVHSCFGQLRKFHWRGGSNGRKFLLDLCAQLSRALLAPCRARPRPRLTLANTVGGCGCGEERPSVDGMPSGTDACWSTPPSCCGPQTTLLKVANETMHRDVANGPSPDELKKPCSC